MTMCESQCENAVKKTAGGCSCREESMPEDVSGWMSGSVEVCTKSLEHFRKLGLRKTGKSVLLLWQLRDVEEEGDTLSYNCRYIQKEIETAER